MKNVHESGKRKMAVARATIKTGTGKVTINKINLDSYQPILARHKILEPVILAKESMKTLNIDVKVNGGGVIGQAEAARLAIARALVKHNAKLKTTFLEYDRQLLVADVRRKEVAKPNSHGKARAKRQKSYR